MADWYYVKKGENQGPISFFKLFHLFKNGEISKQTLVWTQEFGDEWKPFIEVIGNEDNNDQSQPEDVPIPLATFSIRAIFKQSFNHFSANLTFCLVISTILISSFFLVYQLSLLQAPLFIPFFLTEIIQSFLMLGIFFISWRLVTQQPTQIRDLFSQTRLIPSVIVAKILLTVLIFLILSPSMFLLFPYKQELISLGNELAKSLPLKLDSSTPTPEMALQLKNPLALLIQSKALVLIIFNLIVLNYLWIRCRFFWLILIDQTNSPFTSIALSWKLTRGYTLKLFILIYIEVFLVLLGAVFFFGLGLLFTLPLTYLLQAKTYQLLKIINTAKVDEIQPS